MVRVSSLSVPLGLNIAKGIPSYSGWLTWGTHHPTFKFCFHSGDLTRNTIAFPCPRDKLLSNKSSDPPDRPKYLLLLLLYNVLCKQIFPSLLNYWSEF